LTKLATSLIMYGRLPAAARSHTTLKPCEILHFALPAAFYSINNALLFAIVVSLRPVVFQLLSATKTIFTAIFFRLVLKRLLTTQQQAAVVLLASGAAVSRLGRCEAFDVGSGHEILLDSVVSESVGVMLTLLTCLLSSVAGVANEALLKRDGNLHSIFLQNIILYAWGVIINAHVLVARDYETMLANGVFVGYSIFVVLLIVVNSATGLCIAAVLKHCDNLVRVFAHICAMILSMTIDVAATRIAPTPELLLAVVIVGGSAIVYVCDGAPRPLHADRSQVLPSLL